MEAVVKAVSSEVTGQNPMPIGLLRERMYRYFGAFGTQWGLASMAMNRIACRQQEGCPERAGG
jgi:hypothetical protein